MEKLTRVTTGITVGLDLGDRYSQLCVLDAEGKVVEEGRVATSSEALRRRFGKGERMRIALEAGTHSPWVSRLLKGFDHEVLVANPRKLRLIYQNRRKDDRVDARYLARVARLDPELLGTIEHRGEPAQQDLGLLRSREALVRARTQLVNHVRGAVKSFGSRIPACSTRTFHKKAVEHLPERLRPALLPVVETIGSLTEQIRAYDRLIEGISESRYPETKLLNQVNGVGALTALAFVLTLKDPSRFAKSRTVGAYLGLVPGKDQSGLTDPQIRITKEGDVFLRRLLVQSAHYILGPFGQDSDLRRHGLKLALRGGKNAKKRAVVAVARKLAVLLHHLWRSAEVYEPLYLATRNRKAA